VLNAAFDLDDHKVLVHVLHRVDLDAPELEGLLELKGYKLKVREGGREVVDWHVGAEDLVRPVVDPKEVHRCVVADQSRVGQE
jgi:hypothetical protein